MQPERPDQMMTEAVRRLGADQVAPYLRDALKAAFPKLRFQVRARLFGGGTGALYVSYGDGPAESEVNAIARRFRGHDVQGTEACGVSTVVRHWLTPENQLWPAERYGTLYAPPSPEAVLVWLQVGHVIVTRRAALR